MEQFAMDANSVNAFNSRLDKFLVAPGSYV